MKSRACCDWNTFESGMLNKALRKSFPESLIDRNLARRHWNKGLTGAEALLMQWSAEQKVIAPIREAEFIKKLNADFRKIMDGDF